MHITPAELQRLNAGLDELQWSDARFAEVIGVDKKTIWTWRTGRQPMPLHAWRFIETALGIKRAYDALKPCEHWHKRGRGNTLRRARMDAQALQRFKDAGVL
jgi:hypothetical protein